MIADFPPLCKIKAQKNAEFPRRSKCLLHQKRKPDSFSHFSPSYDFCRFWPQGTFFRPIVNFQKYLEFPSLVVYTIIVHCSTTVCRKRQPLFHAAHADAKTTFRAAQRRVDRTQICRCCESPEYCGCQRRRGFFCRAFSLSPSFGSRINRKEK